MYQNTHTSQTIPICLEFVISHHYLEDATVTSLLLISQGSRLLIVVKYKHLVMPILYTTQCDLGTKCQWQNANTQIPNTKKGIMYSQFGVGPLLFFCCSSLVPLLYIFCPHVVLPRCSYSASRGPLVPLLLFQCSSTPPLTFTWGH